MNRPGCISAHKSVLYTTGTAVPVGTYQVGVLLRLERGYGRLKVMFPYVIDVTYI